MAAGAKPRMASFLVIQALRPGRHRGHTMSAEFSVHLAGIVTLAGAVVYAIADILLLAHQVGARQQVPPTAVDFTQSDRWQRRAELLTTMSKIPWPRLVRGGLLGVCTTPFVMPGSWVLFKALQPAGAWLSIPVALLWLAAYPVGAFIHGSFIFYGGTVQAWNAGSGESKALLEDLVARQTKVIVTAYIVFTAIALATSVWYVTAVVQGATLLPRWMAFVNPVLMTIVYLVIVHRILPARVTKWVQGAGFNIVYLVFFAMTLGFIW
jgi:Family of unknown function (DUF6796)